VPRSRRPAPPEFFLDRSLGRIIVARALRDLGHIVHAMSDVYPERHERVADTEWIADADAADWVALTKDERILRRPDEQQALVNSTLRVFALANQQLTGDQMAAYFSHNINRIVQRSRKPGPFVDVIYKNSVERRWPR
jgi:hypothetical protein